MTGLRLDFTHAVRSLRRNPTYTAAVVLSLALGIGANTAMFSVLRGVLLQPLPFENGERLVRLYQPNTGSAETGLSPLEMADYRNALSLAAIVEYHTMPFTFMSATESQRLQTGVVSAGFFDALGVRALVGRTFRPGEDQPGSDPVLMLSWEYWQRAFGGDTAVVGTTLRMNDRTHTVIGVLPRFPQYPNENDVYMPASSCPFRSSPGWAENRSSRQPALGLLHAGVSPEAAVAELSSIAARLHETYPEAYPAERRMSVAAVPLADLMTRQARPLVLMLLGATGFLLVLVCANVINLAIVRLLRRDQEIATRVALGASRGRLVSQLVAESALLALAGGALGLFVARVTLGVLVPVVARVSSRAHEIAIDNSVLAFTLFVAVAAGVLGGLLPALLRLRLHTSTAASASARSTSGLRHGRIRGVLILTQVAVSVVLLAGAGLLIRSLANLQRVSPGFDPERVLTARVDLNWTRYATAEQSAVFFRAVEERLAAETAVESAAFASSFPLDGDPASQLNVVTDRADRDTEIRVAVNSVSSNYFAVLGVDLLRGRTLQDSDGLPDAPLAVVLTRASAQRLFGDEDPVGRAISADGGQTWGAVVGVVSDVRHELEGEYEAMLFAHQHRFHSTNSRLLARGSLPPPQLERLVRVAVSDVDPDQPVTDVRTIQQFRNEALVPRRVIAVLLAAFAALALAITGVGIAGVIAFAVAERRREIGIRVALGASPGHVVDLVLRHTLLLTAGGLLLGTLLALLVTRALAALLFGVATTDPVTFAGVAVALLCVAVAAALAPVKRALAIAPTQTLRE